MNQEISRAIRTAAEAIAGADRIAVTGHVNPDGDALGSALALALSARLIGKESVVAFGGGSTIPDHYAFLDLGPVVAASEFPSEPDLMVVFDTAVADRLADLAAAAAAAKTLVVVDHHATEGDLVRYASIDPTASASAILAYHLIRALEWPIDAAVATALHVGIVTDTGRFQYSSTDGDTLRIAGGLVDAGVRPESIGQAIYESVPFGYLGASAAVLGRAELETDLGLIWSVVYDADLAAAGVGPADVDGLIDDLRIAREAGVAALIKEVGSAFKVSLRSRGAVDVGSIAAANGGGGHHNAAGFTAPGPLESVIERVRAGLR